VMHVCSQADAMFQQILWRRIPGGTTNKNFLAVV